MDDGIKQNPGYGLINSRKEKQNVIVARIMGIYDRSYFCYSHIYFYWTNNYKTYSIHREKIWNLTVA